MFHIVLVEPEIPQNTGNIVRTCAATGAKLHLVRPLGFDVSEKAVRRAGLDYWHFVDISYYDSFEEVADKHPEGRFFFFTTKGRKVYSDNAFQDGDFLVFGKETKGLDEELLKAHPNECLRVPMLENLRSLNLSNTVALALYEALRQTGFEGMQTEGELHRLRW
ncbi:MAG: tRNA (uridine(34)/cytosine(34)/5-carboxymethylaminomethyluridine(34)-2'-O)-methyltransferase TrmL [Christensenellaceae bacterium]